MFKGLFDTQSRLAKIDRNGDPLAKLNQIIDWSIFAPVLAPLQGKSGTAKGGRPPYDVMLKFKMLVLQSLYNLSDEALEQQVLDRLSFMRFLGIGMGDDVPDAKTIWAFREQLKNLGLEESLFRRFDSFLNDNGFHAQRGQIVDATIVKAPVRRDSRENNDRIKKGEDIPEWNQSMRSQKDTCARWTIKKGIGCFGYKNHIGVDVRYKLIRSYKVTPASTHDGTVFDELLTANSDPSVYADSAYMSTDRIKRLTSLPRPLLPCINEQGQPQNPMTDEQRKANKARSHVRARVEHVFGAQLKRAGTVLLRGIARAAVKLGLRNLAYNLERYALLCRSTVS